jgi:hypothetical protein
MSAKIAIGETLATAARLVLDRSGELFRVGLVLILGFFAIGVFAFEYIFPLMQRTVTQVGGAAAGQQMPDPRFLPAMLLVVVVEFLIISIFAVGWHRLILLRSGTSGGLGIGFGRREIAFLGWVWACFLGVLMFSVAFSILEFLLAGLLRANPQGFVIIAMLGFTLVVIYVLGRIGLSFAGLSIDQPLTFAASWQATRGEGFRILATYLLVAIGWLVVGLLFSFLAGLLGLGYAAPYALLFINAILSAAFIALLVTINSILFRRLSGWQPAGSPLVPS